MPKSYQTRVINAPIDKVWDTIKNFHDLSWGASIIESCEKIGSIEGSKVGAQRLLNGVFKETLKSVNDEEYSFSYSIDDGVSPLTPSEVSNYLGEVKLVPITQTDETFIEWKSSWDSTSLDAEEFCHGLYVALMEDLNNAVKS